LPVATGQATNRPVRDGIRLARPVGRPGPGAAEAAADGGAVLGGGVTFRRSAEGRIASAFFLDCTWVRLDRVPA
jgi:hypothetical protein